ncbi:Pentacotripeptide-repeat region of PRORP domain-containing protein [Plasmodiophora brassicae]|uniref:Pentacotripeptide-repeat region of PRORP domain-containing protein n=1 Tax=Plasmodiophora brassicae TaxID=37360 RepID=A0A0G4IMZ1_PLABS|nr:hypothetical protein PBRA_005227 [Plasmodiophora brassicae]
MLQGGRRCAVRLVSRRNAPALLSTTSAEGPAFIGTGEAGDEYLNRWINRKVPLDYDRQTPQYMNYHEFLERPSTSSAVHALKHETDPDRGWSIFEKVLSSGGPIRMNVFNVMLQFCKRIVPSKAPDVLDAAVSRDVTVTDVLFTSFLSACSAASPPLVQAALEHYAKVGPKTRTTIYNVAHLCLQASQPGLALALFNDATVNDVGVTWRLLSLFATCCALDRSVLAATTAQRLLGLIRTGRVESHPDVGVFRNLVAAMLAQNQFDAALDAMSYVESVPVQIDETIYELVIAALAKADRLAHAMTLLKAAVKRKVRIDKCLMSILCACKEDSDLPVVDCLYRYASGKGMLEDDAVCRGFVAAFDRCNDLDAAERAFQERCSISTPRAETFNAMVAAYAHHGRRDKATETLQRGRDHGLHVCMRL